jgi:hypothetical protein
MISVDVERCAEWVCCEDNVRLEAAYVVYELASEGVVVLQLAVAEI